MRAAMAVMTMAAATAAAGYQGLTMSQCSRKKRSSISVIP